MSMTRRLRGFAVIALLQVAAVSAQACRGVDLLPEIGMQSQATLESILSVARETPYRHGRLFEVRRAGARSYVFATVHVPDERVVDVPPRVAAALRESRILLVELSDHERVEGPRIAQREGILVAPPGLSAPALLPSREMSALERVATARGISLEALRTLSAGVIALMLDNSECVTRSASSRSVLDKELARRASELGLEVFGLETFREQLRSLTDGFSAEVARALLIAAVRHAERGDDVAETTLQAYLKGDLGLLVSWMRSPEPIPGQPDSALPRAVLNELLDGRSRRMLDRASNHLAAGRAFVAIGAAHLPSKHGFLAMLSEAGYEVRSLD